MWNAKEETEKILSSVDCDGPVDINKEFVKHFQQVMLSIRSK